MRAVKSLGRESRRILALVLAGGNGTRLQGLTRDRAKPAVPFGGHHRIVDYALSNCVNSGITDIAVLTQYKSQSLIRHLQKNWLTGRFADSLEIWPAQQRNGRSWYAGTADAVYQNRDLIEAVDPDDVLVVAADHVYEMDYSTMMAVHVRNGADVTLSSVEVRASESQEFGIVEIDEANHLKAFIEKPDWLAQGCEETDTVLASMGIYFFSTDYMLACLDADARNQASRHDFGYNIVPRIVGDANVYVSVFRTRDGHPGYWRDVGTIDRYWLAHRDLLDSKPRTTDEDWILHGGPRVRAPARITSSAVVRDSLLGADSVIAGTVERTVVSMGCNIGKGSVVNESVLLPDVKVGRDCIVNRVIVDSRCHIPDGTVLDARYIDAADGIHVSPGGVALVTAETMRSGTVQRSLRTA
jgi:glucose-1-phosphate adenylyltransferase